MDFAADDARRAWQRIAGWFAVHPEGGDAALDTLADIGTVRRLLDQATLAAVRTARSSGRSWSEIATRLGMTRQSAWERWRHLDADPLPVPDVIGLGFDEARDVLVRVGLVPVNGDPDAPPLEPTQWRSSVVVRQYPDAGTPLPAGSQVKLWVERGGGTADVREPRRPHPPVREASGEIDLDAVVGE
jgi:hypothetical protein